ncbi:MAG: hypothetical protein K2G60_01855 [Oscillospiraceae bacterium]|nr:hypothetical protein [Oscillospiraceae bacterium]
MTLLITAIAATVSAVFWLTHAQNDKYHLGTLTLIYCGASLMWFMDFVFEYAELHAAYFNQEFSDILNDSILGITVVLIGAVAWIIYNIAKHPERLFKKN